MFTKFKLKLQNVLINYQDLSTAYKSFVFLNACLKRNMNKNKVNNLSKRSHSERNSKQKEISQKTKKSKFNNDKMKSKSADNTIKSTKKDVICFHCKKSNHYKNQCLSLSKDTNSTVINEIKIKRKDQHSTKLC